jgi:hypothetical protein
MSLIDLNNASKQKFEMPAKKLLCAMRFDNREKLLHTVENFGDGLWY